MLELVDRLKGGEACSGPWFFAALGETVVEGSMDPVRGFEDGCEKPWN